MELTKEMLDKMRTGKQMVVSAMNMQQETMAFPLPLTGFGKASDGAPVDNAKYQEARRQMMEKSRQRQLELANKAAEAQQKNQQAGGQPQTDSGAACRAQRHDRAAEKASGASTAIGQVRRRDFDTIVVNHKITGTQEVRITHSSAQTRRP